MKAKGTPQGLKTGWEIGEFKGKEILYLKVTDDFRMYLNGEEHS